MDINQIEIEIKLKKIKNSIYRQIEDKIILKRFKNNMIEFLSEIWNLKDDVKIEVLIVNKINLKKEKTEIFSIFKWIDNLEDFDGQIKIYACDLQKVLMDKISKELFFDFDSILKNKHVKIKDNNNNILNIEKQILNYLDSNYSEEDISLENSLKQIKKNRSFKSIIFKKKKFKNTSYVNQKINNLDKEIKNFKGINHILIF